MRKESPAALVSSLTVAFCLAGCTQPQKDGGPDLGAVDPGITAQAPRPTLVAITADAGMAIASSAGARDAGPNCTGASVPSTGIDAGVSCLGALGQSTFARAVCSCGSINATAKLVTDGFNSTQGPPKGGIGGSIGSNSGETWLAPISVGGDLSTPGNLTASSAGVVRGNLFLGGTATARSGLSIDGNASVIKPLPRSVMVEGTTTRVSSVEAPCDCTNLVPVAAIVAAHRPPMNDNVVIGLSPSVAEGRNASRVDLPCGNYYLSRISPTTSLTVAVHGHAALYVDGDVVAVAPLSFQIDPTATLDLFVAGDLDAYSALKLGSASYPAQCRTYVGGSSVRLPTGSSLDCNVYAPAADFDTSNSPTIYGSLFVNSMTAGAATTIHYDTAIQSAGSECCTAASCSDGNPCTVDSCNGDGTCSHVPATNGTICSGSNACERTYTCQNGTCAGSNPVVCTASDQCHTAGTCNPSTGTCSSPTAADGTACNDGNACTQTDACQSGMCIGSNPVACTASDQCHAAGRCDPSSGACSNPAAANGTACSDGNACTLSDTCQSGSCSGANPVACVASDQCHIAGTCNPSNGTCSNPAVADGAGCNDGNACTQTDSCLSGACTGSNPITCTASDQCHVAGTCDTSSGTCSNPTAANGTACNDGNACTQTDACQSGTCAGSNPVTCAASDACHLVGTCEPASGSCSNPAAPDGTSCPTTQSNATASCTTGVCKAACNSGYTSCGGGCANTQTDPANCGQCGTACASGPNAACNGGLCNYVVATGQGEAFGIATDGTSVYWASPDHGTVMKASVGSSAPTTLASGQSAPLNLATDGTNVCWLNSGNGTIMVVPVAGGGPTTLASGQDVADAGPPNNLATDGLNVYWTDYGSGNVMAVPVSGTGSPTVLASGQDQPQGLAIDSSHVYWVTSDDSVWSALKNGDVLTQLFVGSDPNPQGGIAVDATGVHWTNLTDETVKTVALGGGTASTIANDLGYPYGIATDGTHVYWADTSAGQIMVAGLDGSGRTVVADGQQGPTGVALDSVNVYWTNKADGTIHFAPKPGISGDGGVGDAGQALCGPGANCDDGNACTLDSCDPLAGCQHVAMGDGTACPGSNLCQQIYTCQAAVCIGSNPVSCAASDQCHLPGTCDPGTGACSNPAVMDGTTCNDGNACTQTDACSAGTCTGSNPVTCTAADQCHVAGTCDPGTGACSNPSATDGATCNDGNACTQTDACTAGACAGSNPVTCVAFDQCHVAGICDPGTGTCSNPNATDGATCNDGNACTQTDSCLGGACTGSNPVNCTARDQCHVAGTCDPGTGTCSNPTARDGTTCNDGDACTQTDSCASGVCSGSNPITCTASDQCHVAGTCDPGTGTCSNPNANDGSTCNDGNACTQTDSCASGACIGSNAVTCAPLDACHVPGNCNSATGSCTNPTAADGTSCPTSTSNATASCTGGACISSCNSGYTGCAGNCVNTQTDAHNCGQCGATCRGGPNAACNGGLCSYVIASGQGEAYGLAADGVNVYWSSSDQGTVMASPVGASTPTVVASSQSAPQSVATDGTNVYWMNTGNGAIVKSAISGGGVTTLATAQSLASNGAPTNLATDGMNVYWTDYGSGNVMSVAVAGSGVPVTLESSQDQPLGLAIDSSHVYWVTSDDSVWNVLKNGDALTQLFKGVDPNPQGGLAADQTSVYWTNASDGTVKRVALGGGTATTAASSQRSPFGIVSDGAHLYWADQSSNQIMTSALDGSGALALAAAQASPANVAQDATNVYWTNLGDGSVHSAPKPAMATGDAGAPEGGARGLCGPGITCDDGNPCTADSCDPVAGCEHLPTTDGTACNDGNACTLTDSCQAGTCSGSAAADGTACNDGNACTLTDSCQAGACTGSNPVTCPLSDACHVAGSCNPASGTCSTPAAPDGTACPTSLINESASCANGVCQAACNPGFTNCGGACVNTQYDVSNCGQCGIACTGGTNAACVAGVCAPAPTAYYPIGGGADDWPSMLSALSAATSAGQPLLLMATTVDGTPAALQCRTAPSYNAIPDRATIIFGPGASVVSSLPFVDGHTSTPFYRNGWTHLTEETTLAASAVLGEASISVVSAGGISIGNDIVLTSQDAAGELEAGYTVTNIAGTTIFVDRPVLKPFTSGAYVARSPGFPRNLTIIGNGAMMTGSADRWLQFVMCRDCFVSGLHLNTVTVNEIAISYDYGSLRSAFDNITIDGASTFNWGIAIEDGEYGVIDSSYVSGGGIGMVLNECQNSTVSNSTAQACGHSGFATSYEGTGAWGTHGGAFIDNQSLGNAADGVMIDHAHDVSVIESNAQNNSGYGVAVFGTSTGITLQEDTLMDNTGFGAYMASGAGYAARLQNVTTANNGAAYAGVLAEMDLQIAGLNTSEPTCGVSIIGNAMIVAVDGWSHQGTSYDGFAIAMNVGGAGHVVSVDNATIGAFAGSGAKLGWQVLGASSLGLANSLVVPAIFVGVGAGEGATVDVGRNVNVSATTYGFDNEGGGTFILAQ